MVRIRLRSSLVLVGLVVLLAASLVQAAPGAADSPGRGHAAVIAQGVAVLPPDPVVWRIARESATTGESTPTLRDLGFVVVDGGTMLVADPDGGEIVLDAGEAAFVAGGAEQARTGLGDIALTAYSISLITLDQPIEQNAEILFAGDAFSAPSGKRDLNLVRDVLQQGETGELPMASSGAPTLLFVTAGEIQVAEGDETSTLTAGGAATMTADLTISAPNGPATYLAAVIGIEVVPPKTATGSITVTFFGCPEGVSADDANPADCQPLIGDTSAAIDSESAGTLLALDAATDNGDGSFTWSDLPYGIYTVTDIVVPSDYDGNYTIYRELPDPAPGQPLVELSEDHPDASFSVYGLES